MHSIKKMDTLCLFFFEVGEDSGTGTQANTGHEPGEKRAGSGSSKRVGSNPERNAKC